MNNELTLDKQFQADLPYLEILIDGKMCYYKTESIYAGEILFVDVDNEDHEMYINIKDLLPETERGFILNFEDYFEDLKSASLNQEVEDYLTNKRISN